MDETLSAFGRLDILILVSPFWAGGQIHAHSVTTWDRVLEANLREPFLMARAVLPMFRENKHGRNHGDRLRFSVGVLSRRTVLSVWPCTH